MNANPIEKTQYRALIDTSSVVAHDLCAQLHVLQFCAEELKEFINEDGTPFLEKLSNSANNLENLIQTFRNHLKQDYEQGKAYPYFEVFNGAVELMKNHYYSDLTRLEFTGNHSLTEALVENDSLERMHILFGILSWITDIHKENGSLEKSEILFDVTADHFENSEYSIIVSVNNTEVGKPELERAFKENLPAKGRLRKYLGLSTLNEYLSSGLLSIDFESLDGNTKIILK